jgi:hypothetical protein
MMANVNYHFAGESEHTQLGVIEIEPLRPGLALGSKVTFQLSGKDEVGTVEAICPGLPPGITIRLGETAH